MHILNSGRSSCGSDWSSTVPFRAPFFRLYFVTAGEATLTVGGMEYPLHSGTCAFLPAHVLSSNHCADYMEVYWIHGIFDPASFPAFWFAVREVLTWPLERFAAWNHVYRLLGHWDPVVRDADSWRLQSLLLWVFSEILAHCPARDVETLLGSARMRRAIAFMQSAYRDNPSLREVAQQAGWAPNYFHRRFSELSGGVTPHAFMEQLRMRDAWQLLLSTESGLKQIADAAGYDNVFYFSRVFKRIYGESPARIRERNGAI